MTTYLDAMGQKKSPLKRVLSGASLVMRIIETSRIGSIGQREVTGTAVVHEHAAIDDVPTD